MEIMSFNVVIASWLRTTYSRLFNYRIGIHLLQAEKTNEVDTIAIHSTLHQVNSKTRSQGTTTNHFTHKTINQLLLIFNVLV
jgi:hypothetical protein